MAVYPRDSINAILFYIFIVLSEDYIYLLIFIQSCEATELNVIKRANDLKKAHKDGA